MGSAITIPGVTVSDSAFSSSDTLSLMNMLGGGALQSFSLFRFRCLPYITAQIHSSVVTNGRSSSFSKILLSKVKLVERKKIDMTTRYLTLVLAAVQAYGIIVTMQNIQGLVVNDTLSMVILKLLSL